MERYDVIVYLAETDHEWKETGKEVPMQYAKACDGMRAIASVVAALTLPADDLHSARVVRVEVIPR